MHQLIAQFAKGAGFEGLFLLLVQAVIDFLSLLGSQHTDSLIEEDLRFQNVARPYRLDRTHVMHVSFVRILFSGCFESIRDKTIHHRRKRIFI